MRFEGGEEGRKGKWGDFTACKFLALVHSYTFSKDRAEGMTKPGSGDNRRRRFGLERSASHMHAGFHVKLFFAFFLARSSDVLEVKTQLLSLSLVALRVPPVP